MNQSRKRKAQMKIKNTTQFPNQMLRRMTSWCCRQLDISPRSIRRIKFRNRTDGFTSGHCYSASGVICVSVGTVIFNDGRELTNEEYRTARVNELVRVSAHEVAHRALA